MKMITTYRGKQLEEMSREELITVVEQLGRLYNNLAKERIDLRECIDWGKYFRSQEKSPIKE